MGGALERRRVGERLVRQYFRCALVLCDVLYAGRCDFGAVVEADLIVD